MSFPDGASYWHDVKAAHSLGYRGEVKLHAPAEGVSRQYRAPLPTLCGETVDPVYLRSKRGKITCRACLAKLCRFVVTHEVGGATKVLLATDDGPAAQQRLQDAVRHRLVNVQLTDRGRCP